MKKQTFKTPHQINKNRQLKPKADKNRQIKQTKNRQIKQINKTDK